MLVQLVGDDLHALALEVDKLAVWADGEPIGEREVEALASPAAGEPTFALTDAWGAHDTGRALAASETIFERSAKPRRDTASRLAATLGSHFGRLRSIKRLAAEGVRPREAAGKLRMRAGAISVRGTTSRTGSGATTSASGSAPCRPSTACAGGTGRGSLPT